MVRDLAPRGFSRDGETPRPAGSTSPSGLTSGRVGRWGPVLMIVVGSVLLLVLFWQVIAAGGLMFVAVRRLLPNRHRGRRTWLRELPRWVEAAAMWRGAGRIGR